VTRSLPLRAALLALFVLLACEAGPVETGANPPPPPTHTSTHLRHGPHIGIQDTSGEASEEDAERFRKEKEKEEEEKENSGEASPPPP
jgi:hypothetical protein